MATTLMDSLKKNIGKKKNKSQAFAWLADLERQSGDLETALARVDGGLTLYPSDVPAMLVRSMILFEKGDFEGCVMECEKALKFDPFCLSAQKRMGDAYEQMGDENERNKCYRRVHDMDPLDTFWKEEYDHVEEDAADAAAVAAAVMSDDDFSMPSDLSMDMPATESDAAPAETATAEMGGELAAESAESAEVPADDAGFDAQAFADFSAIDNSIDGSDDSTMDSLQESLESAMNALESEEPSAEQEVFPADDEVSGSDVSSALSDMFGADDDLEPEAPASPFAKLDLPTSLDEEPAVEESSVSSVFGNEPAAPAVEDKPQSVDSAFADIFGEDELPEEKPVAPAVEDKPQSVDSAFADIFGEDELPEEKPQTTAASVADFAEEPMDASSGLFEKSAEEDSLELDDSLDSKDEGSLFEKSSPSDVFGDLAVASDETLDVSEPAAVDESPAFGELPSLEEAPAVEETPAAEQSLVEESTPASETASAFDDIFGADDSLDIPEEKPAAEETPVVEDKPFAVEGNASVFDDLADDTLTIDEPVVEETPAAEESLAVEDVPAAEPAAEPAEDKFSVDNAFDSIFGSDDDDLPEEKAAEPVAEEPAAEPFAEEPASESLAEQVSLAENELEMPSAEPKEQEDNFAKEMGSALSNIFGDDDSLDFPEAKEESVAPAASQEDTGAAVEEAPLKEESLESDLDKSFSNLFGDDDLPEENSAAAAETVAEESPVEEAPAAPEAPAAVETDSLESAVDGAFKGLFSTDDDLPEEKAPNNSGVDFLMSGDSDDEVSSGLIKDPTAPLERGAADIDESLNTKTLAEIYFEQGLYEKALDIYEDLARKEPDNAEIMNRLMEVEKVYREKFGGNNG